MGRVVEKRASQLPQWDEASIVYCGTLRSTLASSSVVCLRETWIAPQDGPRCGVLAGPAGVRVRHQQEGHESPTGMRAECSSRLYGFTWVPNISLIFQYLEASQA